MNERVARLSSFRWLLMCLILLAMSCEADGDGDGCMGDMDGLITGCSDGCGTDVWMHKGDGCLSDCIFGDADGCNLTGEGGCGDCGDCGDCGGCSSSDPYDYDGDVVEGAVQIHVTDSFFEFLEGNLLDLVAELVGDEMEITPDGEIRMCFPPGDDLCSTPRFNTCNNPGEDGCCMPAADGGPDVVGCPLNIKLGDVSVSTEGDRDVKVRVEIDDIKGKLFNNKEVGNCWIDISRTSGDFWVELRSQFNVNPVDGNTEMYIGGGNDIGISMKGLSVKTSGSLVCGLAQGQINESLVRGIIGGVPCRGCNSNADCGGGGTCSKGMCRDNSGRKCQGVQLGVQMGLDAGGLLQMLDPSAEAALGIFGFLGSYVKTNVDGLQLGMRLGANAAEPSLCVPRRPSPAIPNKESCRDGATCPMLSDLNTINTIKNPATDEDEEFHLGIGVSMSSLNQILWSAYDSGALCLSISGETDMEGMEMLGTELVSLFVKSLSTLTYGKDQPLLIQLRPQQAPIVDFKEDVGQGAEMDVYIPEMALDFYTIVDERYMRVFTLQVDLELPLGVHIAENMVEIALGDLEEVIVPGSVVVQNVEMVSPTQVQSLANNLPSIIALVVQMLGDDLIPPFEIPEIEGLVLDIVGPGTTMLLEDDEPAAIGIFAKLGFGEFDIEFPGGLRPTLEPVITQKSIDIPDPVELRADIAARRAANESFGYRDLMPDVRVTMDTVGAAQDEVEYAYRINNGPWSFWKRGPELIIDNPVLATEGKFNVRITARYRGDSTSGATQEASFDFINDYSAPHVKLIPANGNVIVDATDNVYNVDELTMQVRFNGGAWSKAAPLAPIDVAKQLADGPAVVDVIVNDPSGNSRMVRRTFGEKTASSAAAVVTGEGPESCASSQGKGGLVAMLAFMFMLVLRRRRGENPAAIAATPLKVTLLVFAFFALAMTQVGCANNDKGSGTLTPPTGDECEPGCKTNEICEEGVCIALGCTSNGDCPGASECIDGSCSRLPEDLTCGDNDDCEYGEICKDGQCTDSECTTAADCTNLNCEDGELPFCDYDDYQYVEAGECVCAANSLAVRDHGTWLQMFQTDAEDVIAAVYNIHYGDVMVGQLQEDDTFAWTFVDGIPEGPVEFPPAGLRNGVTAKGDDAGKYLTAAYESVDGSDVLHLAYQYEARSAADTRLRYARGERSGDTWSWTFIDLDDDFVPGFFPSIALVPDTQDNEGGIAITYMTADVVMDAGNNTPAEYYSELSVAWSNTRTPESADDFTLTEGVDQVANPVACGGRCPGKTVCHKDSNACVSTATGCNSCNEGQGEQCVQVGDNATCAVVTQSADPAFKPIPHGVGLFSSAIARDNGRVQVSYYDQRHGILKLLELERVDGALVPVDSALIIDGEQNGQSTGDVGRWSQIHADGNDVVIFYEDAGRAELRAARVSGNQVKITVLDDGRYYDKDNNRASTNRVGTSIDVIPRDGGGFDIYYLDATYAVVRHLVWTNLNNAPTAFPYAVFGSRSGLTREILDFASAAQRPEEIAVASDDGGYGLYTQVLALEDTKLFASKHVGTSSAGSMDVRAARLSDEGLGGDPGNGGSDPSRLECSSPGSTTTDNGTVNQCLQCTQDGDYAYWTEQPAPVDIYRCVAHHDSSSYDTSCDQYAFYDDSNCGSKDGANFRLQDYQTTHLCARAIHENETALTQNTNSSYWEKVANPENLIKPQWPEDFAEMTHQSNKANSYINTIETRNWVFDRAFRYLGILNGQATEGSTFNLGWDASQVSLSPGQTEWFAFYYNDRANWQDRVGVLVQFDDEHMEIETELHYVCAHDGNGGRPRLDGFRRCGAEGFGNKGDRRADMGVRCGETGELSLSRRDGSGNVNARYSSCIGDTWTEHSNLPWTHNEGKTSPDITPNNWGQIRGGIYVEGHIDCGTRPQNDARWRQGWVFVRVTRKAVQGDARADVCTPIVIRPTWWHHSLKQPFDACW